VSDVPSIETAFERVWQTWGRMDILINNAGIEQVCASLDVTEALWDRIVGTNLKGAFFAATSGSPPHVVRREHHQHVLLDVGGRRGRRRSLRGIEVRSRRAHPCARPPNGPLGASA